MIATISQPDTAVVLDEYFQDRRQQVPVLAQRAAAEGVTAVRSPEDLVPLLFPHTTYKSYPESLLVRGQWAQLNRWLDSLSTHRVADVDVSGVADIDDWIERLHAAGHLVSSSSGTSGKSSFLNKSQRDRDVSLRDLVDSLISAGISPEPVWHVIPLGPDTGISHHRAVLDAIIAVFGRPDPVPTMRSDGPKGHHRYMARFAAIRRALADGTAQPDEVAEMEAEAARRRDETEQRLQFFAEQLLHRRDERFLFNAMFPPLYRLCEILRDRGASEGDLSGGNALTTGGGLKGAALPPDYRATTFAMLDIAPSRFLHYYSMQELNLRCLKCAEGRYHVPPDLVLFVLDKDGESLAPVSDGQAEGRAAFCDTTVDGRWGGTISGDKILAELGTCPCGRPGPTVFDDITRFSDLADGDKITCAGTIDAYVRGFLAE